MIEIENIIFSDLMKKMRLHIIISLSLFLFKMSFSQTKISGLVTDENNTPLYLVSVILKNKVNKSTITYSFTKNAGEYILKTEKTGKFNLTFSSLGFESKTVVVEIKGTQKEIKIDVVLKEKFIELNEVIIQSDLPMSIKKDTISFKTKFYAKGNEQTVEDLLKNIPGINITAEGAIKIGNQEIEKLMIDGDDFFEKGYKILSKNMPAYPIEEIEVLKNYSNNRLLKGIENSNKVALNLKLKDDAKRIWFGNIESASNFKNRYELRGNLMNFGKKNKYYFLTNLNNTGNNAAGDINHLRRPFRIGEPTSIGDNQQVNSLINLSAATLNFKKQRTNFNNAELLSLNAIFNPTKKLKIKTLGFFNWDEQDFFRNTTDVITANGTNFTNTENFEFRDKQITGFGKIDLIYNISKTKMLESTTKYNKTNTNGQSNLVFNGASTIENLKANNTFFDQKITYSNKFKDKKVLLLTGRFIDEKTPQEYSVNQFLYQNLFPSLLTANNAQQQSENKMQFAGFEAHLLNRKTNGDLLELQFGNEYRKDDLNTTFTLFESNTALETPNGFQNTTTYQTNDLYLKSKYRYKFKDFSVIGKLGFHQLFNQLKTNSFSENQNPFFVNPSIGLGWEINNKNKIYTSYSYNTTNAKILDVYDNYVLNSFRSFTKGTGSFNQLNAQTVNFSYQLGNWSDRFFANASIFHTKNFDFFSSNTLINQNFTQSERIVIEDREMLNVSSKFDYYFKQISSNLKLELGYSKSNYKNVINNSNLREVISNNYNYGLELRSGFKGVFNYHIGTKWTVNQIETPGIINSFTNNVSFLDVSFIFNDKFNMNFQTERYFFGNLETDNIYYFLDFDARYTIKKNKLTLAVSGKNLLNIETFKTFSISDISTSTTEFRLLERFVLLKMEYRF